MATIAMLVGGAVVNALAFSGSNYLFSKLNSSGIQEETRRHNQAVEQLNAAHEKWSKARTERLDWINEARRRQDHAVQTFHEADDALDFVTAGRTPLWPEPQLSEYYTPSGAQKTRELAFVVAGIAATGIVAYKLA